MKTAITLVLGIVALIVAFVMWIQERKKQKRYPGGWTIAEAVRYLENETHCGKSWNIKARVDKKNKVVFVSMVGNERVEVNLITGKVSRVDYSTQD